MAGNTVRKYLKNKYELDNKQISFYVDRSGEWGNSVHVYLLYFAMPEFANKQIFYSTDQSIPAISASLKRYTEVPYIYVLNDPDLCVDDEVFAYVVISNKADLPYEEGRWFSGSSCAGEGEANAGSLSTGSDGT